MRVYATHFHDPHQGEIISWHGSHRAAATELAQLKRDRSAVGLNAQGCEEVKAHDVPTDKAGLLRWLNANLTANNG